MSELGREGWFEDPSDRHEYRWFSDGKPTSLVRDGTETSRDALSITDASAFAAMELAQPPDTAPLLHQPDGAPHLELLNLGAGPAVVINTNSEAAYRALLAWPSATEQFLIFGVVVAALIALVSGAVAVFGGLSLLAVLLAVVLSGRRGRRAQRGYKQPVSERRARFQRVLAIGGALVIAAAYLAAGGYAIDASLQSSSSRSSLTPVADLAVGGSSVTSATNRPAAAATNLSARLLTVGDLPFGWVTTPVASDGTLTADCTIAQVKEVESATVASEFEFEGAEKLGESLHSYAGAAQARMAYDADVAYAGGCSTFAYHSRLDSNLDTTMTGHRLTIPAFGDASDALEYVGSVEGTSVSVDLVFILSGDTIVEIEESDSGPTDPDTAVTAARTAYAKDHREPAG